MCIISIVTLYILFAINNVYMIIIIIITIIIIIIINSTPAVGSISEQSDKNLIINDNTLHTSTQNTINTIINSSHDISSSSSSSSSSNLLDTNTMEESPSSIVKVEEAVVELMEKKIIVEDTKKDEELNKPALLDSHIVIIKRLCGRELFKEIQMIRFPKSEKPVVDDLGITYMYGLLIGCIYVFLNG